MKKRACGRTKRRRRESNSSLALRGAKIAKITHNPGSLENKKRAKNQNGPAKPNQSIRSSHLLTLFSTAKKQSYTNFKQVVAPSKGAAALKEFINARHRSKHQNLHVFSPPFLPPPLTPLFFLPKAPRKTKILASRMNTGGSIPKITPKDQNLAFRVKARGRASPEFQMRVSSRSRFSTRAFRVSIKRVS